MRVGSVLRFGSARLFATRDTINPLTPERAMPLGREGGHAVAKDVKRLKDRLRDPT